MLILSRKEDEEICIGDDIRITVVEIRGGRVHLGIAAPVSIPVHRREVYEKIQTELARRRKQRDDAKSS